MTGTTQTLARYIVNARPDDIPAAVEHEGKRCLLHWIGCSIGGSREASVDVALGAVREIAGAGTASVLGRTEKLDLGHAAFINGVSADVLSFSDTHPATLIHAGGVFSSVPGALPHVKAGKLRALAVTSAKRSRAAPELPTIAESGFPGYEANNWLGLLVPARTPAPVVGRLNRETVTVLKLPDVQERLGAQGGEAEPGSPEQFAAYLRAEIRKWAKVVKDSGAQAE